MTRLLIMGAGGFGFEVGLICDRLLAAGYADFDNYAFLDDDPNYARERGAEDLIAGDIENHECSSDDVYVCAIGNPVRRRYITDTVAKRGGHFINIIDPSSIVAERAELGRGIVICAHAFVAPFVKLGDHVHVNVSSSIGHDTVVERLATLSAHVDLTGFSWVGEGAFFGTNSSLLPNHRVGAWARIGAGCAIARSIAKEAIVYADPPKFLSRGKRSSAD